MAIVKSVKSVVREKTSLHDDPALHNSEVASKQLIKAVITTLLVVVASGVNLNKSNEFEQPLNQNDRLLGI